MATGAVAVSEGSGKNLATNSITEDAITKQLSRAVLNKSDGSDVFGTAGVPGSAVMSVQGVASYGQSVSLTRTADTNAYAANDVVGAAPGSTAALTFASMGPSGASVLITSISLEIDATAIISGETSYRLYLYSVTPPSALGDNVAFDLPAGDRASFLGYVDLGTPIDIGSTLYVQSDNVNRQVKLSSSSIFGYLVTIGAHTPTSARVYVIKLNTVA